MYLNYKAVSTTCTFLENIYITYQLMEFLISAKKFFPITFLGSILWIAAFSYLMVWWATVTGNTVGIPPEVRKNKNKQAKEKSKRKAQISDS